MPTSSSTIPKTAGIPRIVEPLCAVFRRSLRGAGLKYTPERARILEAVLAFDAVFQAEQLIDAVRAGGTNLGVRVSKATVYRTIKLLEESGIVQRVPMDAEQSHYFVAYGRESAALLVHTDTRQIEAIDSEHIGPLVADECRKRGLSVLGHRLVIYAQQPASSV